MSTNFILLESMSLLQTIPQYQTLAGIFLGLWLLWAVAKRRQNLRAQPTDLEIQRKLEAWHPMPLVTEVNPDHPSLKPKTVSSRVGKRLIVDGKDCLNLGTHNYLGFLDNKEIEDKAISTVRKYGVGSCGPRAFYGTSDVHLELEERLANFMNVEDAIVYSYSFSTIASAIAAYCKRRDIIFADEKINFAVQKGIDASRSDTRYFKHNDVADFERLLIEQANTDEKNLKKAGNIRRFLIIEGIYMNTGLVCPLPQLVALCRKYKVRIFMDESVSFGTLGKTGRGVTEHFGVPIHEIDMIIGSLEWAISSIGGFCIGSSFVIEHHRLSGSGYCFSASLPPLLAAAACTAIDLMAEDTNLFKKLKRNCLEFHSQLKELDHFELSAIPESPVKHLFLKEKVDRGKEEEILREISDKCVENNLAVVMTVYLEVERNLPRPSLRICVSNVLAKEDIDFSVEILKKCSNEVLP